MGFPAASALMKRRADLVAAGGERLALVAYLGEELEAARNGSDRSAEAETEIKYLKALEEAREVLFDRNEEVTKLIKLLCMDPISPILVLGPKDTGKSMVLKHVQALCENLVPVFLLDLRASEFLTPDAFAAEMKARLTGWLDVVFELMGSLQPKLSKGNTFFGTMIAEVQMKVSPKKAYDVFRKAVERASGLSQVISCFSKFLDEDPTVGAVLIIDETDCLKSWEKDFSTDLKVLLDFFAWLTKQQRRARVILSSSDDFFRSWLHDQAKLQYRIFGLGNFDEAAAKEFFANYCFLGISPQEPWEDKWSDIFSATGGSPSQLRLVAQLASDMPWKQAILSLVIDAVNIVENALFKFSSEDQVEILKAMNLVVQKNGFVYKNEMEKTVRRDLVLKMVEDNIFHLRYCTPAVAYSDVDPGEVYGNYIMPFRPPYLEAMRRFVKAEGGQEE